MPVFSLLLLAAIVAQVLEALQAVVLALASALSLDQDLALAALALIISGSRVNWLH